MSQKPSIPKGTRDFLPEQMVKRNYIFDTIRTVFKKYGFLPIETPAVENLSTLMGKYGEEGDRLIFKILNSGDYLKKADKTALVDENSTELIKSISEKALRYDLTVPFARFVVQNQNEIAFPFKRYQIQPVWRADRPQKGRYREFFQCDADVVGSDSLLYEVELIQLYDEVLTNLRIPDFTIKINNRKILSGIAEIIGKPEKIVDITVAIDKLDKIGKQKVIEELQTKGFSDIDIAKINPLFAFTGSNQEKIEALKKYLSKSKTGLKGIEELEYVFDKIDLLGLKSAKLELDVTLARGLNYYTGAIYEVKANGVKMGSICGGGRYDDLTGVFGLKGVSGVGISFGADRIYDVLQELDLFPKSSTETTQVLFLNFGEDEQNYCLPLLKQLRELGINSEIYPTKAKMKKQMTYANSKNVGYVVMVGTQEMESGKLSVKNMETGEQSELTFDSLLELFKK
jgi:histidyl-tRNA synthetase